MNRFIATRAQREAIYRLFARYYDGFVVDLARQRQGNSPTRLFPNRVWWNLYRLYRKRFNWSGCGSDYYLFGQPFAGPLFVGIERDGYTHS